MGGFTTSLVTVLTAITGIALLAVLVSKNAQTPAVLNSFWGGFGNSITAATAPVTGTAAANISGSSQNSAANLVASQLASFGSTANLI